MASTTNSSSSNKVSSGNTSNEYNFGRSSNLDVQNTTTTSNTNILTTKKIISPRRPSLSERPSLNITERPTIQLATINTAPIPLRINTNVTQPTVQSQTVQQQQFFAQQQQQQQQQMTSSPTSPEIQPQPLRTTLSTARKPKKATKNPFALNKLQLPTKKSEYEITNSGTWKYDNFQIAPYGMKASSSTPSSSTSNTWTPSPITPDQYFNKQQQQQQQQQQPTNLQSSIASQKLQLEQLEKRFAQMTTESSSTVTDYHSSPSRKNSSDSETPPSTGYTHITYDQLYLGKKSKLGEGASATVHRVIHKMDEKVYALKIVPLSETDIQPKQIISEIRSLYESMECPYIVRFYEAFHREGSIRILLEYMDCGSLEDVYKTVGAVPEEVLSVISFQILHGLNYLEQKKILHRDIKPSNILMNRDGSAKISDFGMSKQLTTSLQAFKTFIGTYVYMSPERLKGEEHSYTSDVWSLGVSIAECAIGQFPFDLKQLGVWEVLSYITDKGLDVRENQVSPELMDFLKKCTIPDPVLRPSASKLLQHPWIVKHQSSTSKDNREIAAKWLNDVYRPERKRKHQIKHQEKEKRRRDSLGKEKKSPRENRKY